LILILSNMPGMTGLELLPKAKAARPDVPVIMITAYGDAQKYTVVLPLFIFDPLLVSTSGGSFRWTMN
jgi:CheY-like chemotaxis protein